jgi:hypothetical protein
LSSSKKINTMPVKFKPEGKCLFCGETSAQADIDKHLSTHLKEIAKSGQAGKSFLVKAEPDKRYGMPHFLSLWIDGETAMKTIDKFLREIWLECCGHLSEFDNVEMSQKAKTVFPTKRSLNYEYDFGSSTNLTLTVVDEYPVKAEKKVVLLSRNEPVNLMCSTCKKVPATQICTVCMYQEHAVFCDTCAKKHAKKCEDFDDYASLPIVNSPRMGVCGYTGGSIDKERDGVYKM